MKNISKKIGVLYIIGFLFLSSCSNINQYPENVREYAYTRSDFDISVIENANRRDIEIYGESCGTPSIYKNGFDRNSYLSINLLNLFKTTIIYNDTNPVKGGFYSFVCFVYYFEDDSYMSIGRYYEDNDEIEPINAPYYEGNNIYYKDFYLCWMVKGTIDLSYREKFVLDFQTKENLQKYLNLVHTVIKEYEN